MSLLQFFRRRSTAPVARERLQILLAPERVAGLKEEILAVIARHVQIDRDKVNVKLDRGDDVNTLEIEVEMPPGTPVRA